jgi:hypothetical protein
MSYLEKGSLSPHHQFLRLTKSFSKQNMGTFRKLDRTKKNMLSMASLESALLL